LFPGAIYASGRIGNISLIPGGSAWYAYFWSSCNSAAGTPYRLM